MTAFSHLARPKMSPSEAQSYFLHNAKWFGPSTGVTPVVTYAFTAPATFSDIRAAQDIAAIERALQEWEKQTDISFTRNANGTAADIEFYFMPSQGTAHTDPNRSSGDGQFNTLAVAYWNFTTPPFGAVQQLTDVDIEFDPADFPVSGSPTTADENYMSLVALHELGHAIGLLHPEEMRPGNEALPEDMNQIMHGLIDPASSSLAVGDVAGAQFYYGAPSGGTSNFQIGNQSTAANEVLDSSAQSQDMQIYGLRGNDTLLGGTGTDMLFGGIGNDSLNGNGGQDLVFDAFGNDTLIGGAGEDNLHAIEGRNLLQGGASGDALRGGIGNDTLEGGAGSDALFGDDLTRVTSSSFWFGDDVLEGGVGNDLLEGGLGDDVFVFAPGEGNDKIGIIVFNSSSGFSISSSNTPDFQVGRDQLDVTSFGFSSETQVLTKLSQSSNGAVFNSNGTSVTLYNVDVGSLSINDFIW